MWCAFPFSDEPYAPGVKERPALVRAVALYANRTRLAVEVTYGTSQLKLDVRQHDLIISNAEEMSLAGLPQATRFDLDKTRWLPWAKEFFTPREGTKVPIVGHLHPKSCEQLELLKGVRARLAAVAKKQFRPQD